MARTFTIRGRIEAEDAASPVIKNVEGSVGGLGESLSSLAPTVLSVGAAFTALTAFLKGSLAAANEQEDAIAKLDSALKLLGPSGVAVGDALKRQADQLQATTRFSDEAVESAQALLATYGVQADVLQLATQATADLAARLGIDLQTAAGQVGAAFNGVTRGLEKVVPGLKSVSDAGFDGAQNIKLLADTMAGGATDAANTYTGSLDKLKNKYGELQEAIGKNEQTLIQSTGGFKILSAVLDTLIALATSGIPVVNEFANVISGSSSSVDKLVRSVTTLAQIQDRSTRIISEQATAQARASEIAKELGVTLEFDVIQKRQHEAELLQQLAILEQQGADVRVAAVASTKELGAATAELNTDYEELGTSVQLSNAQLQVTPALLRAISAEAAAAAQQILFTVQAFDQLRAAGGGVSAIENALAGGGQLINHGTMIQFPDGSVRLVDATLRGTAGGGQFVSSGRYWYNVPSSWVHGPLQGIQP